MSDAIASLSHNRDQDLIMYKDKHAHDPIMVKANEWVTQVRAGCLTPNQYAEFERWCAADPRHARAVAAVEKTWELMAQLRGSPRLAMYTEPKPLSLRKRLGIWRPHSGWSALALRWPAVAMCLMLFVWGGLHLDQWHIQLQADYYTSVGEVRSIVLEDGSQVILGSQSAFSVDYDRQKRRVYLLQGEAVFAPAARTEAEPRPFVVTAAGATGTALGTRFLVRVTGTDQGLVGVTEHSVQLAMDNEPSRVLKEGESATFAASTGIQPLEQVLADETSWQRGQLIFRSQPLDYVLQRVDSYRPGRLLLLNRQLADQRFSAVLPIADLDKSITLEVMQQQLNLKSLNIAGITLLY